MAKQIWLDACRLAAGDHEEARRALFLAQQGNCWWCEEALKRDSRKPAFPPEKGVFSQVVLNIPLTENGKWWPSNLRLVCPKCAVEKDARDRARQIGRRTHPMPGLPASPPAKCARVASGRGRVPRTWDGRLQD